MNALRATAALLAGAALTLALPVQAQWSSGTGGGGAGAAGAPGAGFAAPAARPGRPNSGWSQRGEFTGRMRRGGGSGDWQDPPKPRRERHRNRHGWWGGGYLYGGAGYDGWGYGRDQGYFSQSGERPLASNGQAYFDYDRGYPYDHYSEGRRDDEERSAARVGQSCEMEWTRDLADGDLVPVRVCRN